MMKRLLFFPLCMLVALSVLAQNDKPATSSSEGYFNLTQLSFIIGERDEMSPTGTDFVPSVTMVNGYRFNEHWSLGVGIGVTAYSYLVFPIFADIRCNLFKGAFTPVIAFRGGYALANNEKAFLKHGYYYDASYKNSGGWMCNPEIGFKTTINPHFEFMLTVGYHYQTLESKITYSHSSGTTHNLRTDVNRLSLTLGFLFK